MNDLSDLMLHEDEAMFKEALNFTASTTGFNVRLIEKDYFCTLVLAYLANTVGEQLVFKGGTCLAKVYAKFYRLSEDLDFVMPLSVNANRAQRSRTIDKVKKVIEHIADYSPSFTLARQLTGTNLSTQYNGIVEYASPISKEQESILIEVSVREPLFMPSQKQPVKTLMLNPIGDNAIIRDVDVECIAIEEAVAEKFRAALSRKEVAIRDFYDIDYLVRNLGVNVKDKQLVKLVQQKMGIPGNAPADISPERLADLKRQYETRLRPVLRHNDFKAFDLERAIQFVLDLNQQLH